MLIDELYRKNVGYFVADVWNDEHKALERLLQGTVFFVCQLVHPGWAHYIVTARHVVEGAKGCSATFIRANTSAGGYEDVPVSYSDWIFHPNTDVAVCKAQFPPQIEAWFLPNTQSVGEKVWLGHDVFVIGMFSELPGQKRVEAIARFGKVALPRTVVPLVVIPDSDETVDANVCLVESRSWGGESGSPVFLYEEHLVIPGYYERAGIHESVQKNRVTAMQVSPPLLGLLHGHFQTRQAVKWGVEETGADVSANTGIAAVIPVHEIYATLMDERLVKDREEIKKRLEEKARKRATPVPDSTRARISEKPFTKSDFESALKKVSRKIVPKANT